jgi:hypothetical protein
MDKIVHFEIPAASVERAKKFYSEAFGWQISGVEGMAYNMVTTTPVGEDFRPTEPGSINGGLLEKNQIIQAPVLVINVDEINAALERVKKSGGQMVRDPDKVGDMGIVAYFKDTEGNVLGLWQALRR